MDTNTIVILTPTTVSTLRLGFPQENPPRPGKPGGGLPAQRFSRLIPKREEVVGDELELKLGASNAERQLAPPIGQAYTLPEIDSTPAITQTLAEVRSLRDEALADDQSSRGGLALAQVSLILTRLTHNIPSGRADFESLIRVYQRTA